MTGLTQCSYGVVELLLMRWQRNADGSVSFMDMVAHGNLDVV